MEEIRTWPLGLEGQGAAATEHTVGGDPQIGKLGGMNVKWYSSSAVSTAPENSKGDVPW